jgi:hypothetical protein
LLGDLNTIITTIHYHNIRKHCFYITRAVLINFNIFIYVSITMTCCSFTLTLPEPDSSVSKPSSLDSNGGDGLELDEAGRGSIDTILKHVTFNDNKAEP